MHVDGFRFDLASALARSLHDVDKLSSFFDTIHQDPVISQVKLIAEPWDVGDGGYQVGEFPPLWTEWNGKYRDTVRSFWAHGADDGVRDLAYRLSGSSDLYGDDGRLPIASINFVTAHDGFTMRDLVSYETKHNEANGEDNRDGTDDNRSYNCGVEGDPAPAEVEALRRRQARNLLSTLLLSTGAPMLVAGDERWRTQRGNNNAYVQDNEVSWLDWTPQRRRRRHARARRPAARAAPRAPGAAAERVLRGARGRGRRRRARTSPGSTRPAASWPTGDWFDTGLRSIGMYLDGRAAAAPRPRAASRSSTSRSCCCCTPATTTASSACPGRRGRDALRAGGRHRPPSAASPRRRPRSIAGGAELPMAGALGAAAARARARLTARRTAAGRLDACAYQPSAGSPTWTASWCARSTRCPARPSSSPGWSRRTAASSS